MKRTEKHEMAASLAEIFNSAQVGLLVDYRGLNVAQLSDLRRKLHAKDTQIRILQNRIAKIAIKGTPFAALADHLSEPRALVFGQDPVAPAKVVTDFLKTNDKATYIGGMLITRDGGSPLDAARMTSLGNLPSREVLLVKLLYVMNATQTQFVSTLNEIPAKFVRTLAAIAESKGS